MLREVAHQVIDLESPRRWQEFLRCAYKAVRLLEVVARSGSDENTGQSVRHVFTAPANIRKSRLCHLVVVSTVCDSLTRHEARGAAIVRGRAERSYYSLSTTMVSLRTQCKGVMNHGKIR